MDEMAVYFEDAITQTVDTIGRQHVVMKSNGFASVRITVVASVWGYEKAPPMVIHNAWNTIQEVKWFSGPILAVSQSKGWVDS